MPYILSFVLGILGGLIFIYFPIFSIFLALVPALICLLNRKYFVAIVCLLFSSIAVLYGILGQRDFTDEESPMKFKGSIVLSKDNIYVFKDINGKNIRVYFNGKLEENRLYSVECKKIDKPKNPYVFIISDFCYAIKLTDEGILNLTLFEKAQKRINDELKARLNEKFAPVMIAMTTGHRHEISKEIKEDFQRTGLIHLLSISGAHFSLLFTVFFIIFKTLTNFIPYKWLVRMTLYITPSQLSIILCFPLLLFYFLLIEPNYPSTRAFIMAMLFMIGVLAERKSLWIITVSIACLIILIIEPSSAKDISFQLSFLATIAIGFVSDIYKSFKDRIKNRILSYMFLSLLISFSASFVTAPLVIYKFYYLSIISPIANITAGLLIGMLIFPLNVMFVIVYLITGIYPLPEVINFLSEISFRLMHLLASLSFSSILIPPIPLGSVLIFYIAIFLLILSFYGLNKGSRKIAIAIALLFILFSGLISGILVYSEKKAYKITFLDVGQANSAVIETPKEVFVVDTGKTGFELQRYLTAKGYRDLQALIITHEQKDHAGGFSRIIENFNVREIWDNGYIKYNLSMPIEKRHLERGDILKVGNCTFTVLHPYKGFFTSSITKDSNEVSLVFSVKCLNRKFLFTSDVGRDALESIPLNYLRADIIKVPHHGSKRSFYEDFYEVVSPQICIISSGKNNPYGHPHKEVLEYLNRKCRIYRTDINGAIQIKEKTDGNMELKTFEETRFKPYREWENLKKLFILW
ncbi:MAG: DNA internalization-related competence protein ComEC/Rec2 [Thermodesulfovibrio sp.]|nr:DNA internalization-related competence protein ComEC/Rec2 [Thermodesulfovibrio sp.]